MTQPPDPYGGTSGQQYGYPQPSAQPQYGQPGPYPQPNHGVQPYLQPMYANPPAAGKTNVMALLSLVFALVGLVIAPIVLQLLALIFGIVGKNQIKKTGEGGSGMATAGIVISAIIIALGVIFVVVAVVAYLGSGSA